MRLRIKRRFSTNTPLRLFKPLTGQKKQQEECISNERYDKASNASIKNEKTDLLFQQAACKRGELHKKWIEEKEANYYKQYVKTADGKTFLIADNPQKLKQAEMVFSRLMQYELPLPTELWMIISSYFHILIYPGAFVDVKGCTYDLNLFDEKAETRWDVAEIISFDQDVITVKPIDRVQHYPYHFSPPIYSKHARLPMSNLSYFNSPLTETIRTLPQHAMEDDLIDVRDGTGRWRVGEVVSNIKTDLWILYIDYYLDEKYKASLREWVMMGDRLQPLHTKTKVGCISRCLSYFFSLDNPNETILRDLLKDYLLKDYYQKSDSAYVYLYNNKGNQLFVAYLKDDRLQGDIEEITANERQDIRNIVDELKYATRDQPGDIKRLSNKLIQEFIIDRTNHTRESEDALIKPTKMEYKR